MMSEAVQNEVQSEAPSTEGAERVPQRKRRRGRVVSAKMNKTLIVAVDRRVKHKIYKKYVTVTKRHAVHDEIGCAVGDKVQIEETRPISKTKRWRVTRKLDKGE